MKLRNCLDHTSIYYFGLVLMAIGLPLSHFLMSISQFVLVGNWIWEGNTRQKFRRFRQNKSALVLSSVFLLHILGLMFTTDFNYALNDIRIKLPLLILPIIISSSEPLDRKKFERLMLFFVGSVLLGSVVSISELLGINNLIREFSGQPARQILDIRNISLFISHIRFGLLICIAIFTLVYFIVSEFTHTFRHAAQTPREYFVFQSYVLYSNSQNVLKIIIYCSSLAWLLVFLFILESITGLGILLITTMIILLYFAFTRQRIKQKLIYLGVILAIPLIIITFLCRITDALLTVNPVNIERLDQYTLKGNKYSHYLNNKDVENGNHVWHYVCEKELAEEWNKRSDIKYDGKDQKDQLLKYTLIRFLTSKGFRKDADGVNKLAENEVRSIEQGIANVNYQNAPGLIVRLQEIIWEFNHYMKGGEPGGHSVVQRTQFWKAAIGIIEKNPLTGVGTGDVNTAFFMQYDKMSSPLDNKFRKRAHNQYLTMAVAFGIFGLCWFIFSLFYPLFAEKKVFDYFYMTFFIITLLSMLTEDTLETQAGVSFFAFFNCLLLFGRNERETVKNG
ncbi:MAG: O-antigen ligase family protein [Bacteroidota bacterium]